MTDVVPYIRQPPAEASFTADWLLDPAEIAQRIGGTDFVPQSLRNNPAAITAALLYGAEVGLGRMQSLAKIAVINGRPTLAAEAQRALILAAGHDIWIDESTITRCTIAGRRKDSDQISRVTWTMDDARRANLAGKQAWRMYPRQMLLARASAELARAVFPDAIGGLSATEELEDDPSLAGPADGAAPAGGAPGPERPTRRRKRAGITSGASPSGPQEPAEPEPSPPSPEPEPEPQEGSAAATESPPAETPDVGGDILPPDEQAHLDDAAAAGAHEVEPEPPPPITEPQRRKLHALFRDKGIIDRAERLTYCGAVLDRDIPTSTDMTLDEASQVIDHLEQYDPDNPQTHPLPEGF
jgi:hypothetical protein